MLPHLEIAVRLLVAATLGSLIGFERERLLWAAGIRTHMLVCVGACLVMIVSAYGFNDVLSDHVVLDPSRVAAQVVSGIGFLGAGSILLRGSVIRGLTTAATALFRFLPIADSSLRDQDAAFVALLSCPTVKRLNNENPNDRR